jgi:hypothetical protein
MKLTEKKTSAFTPHPETDGPIKAVIVDITPPKTVQTKFGEKEMFRLVFETSMHDDENDRQWCIWSRNYTPSLNEKASFRKDLKKIMGRDLTKAELEEFDTEALIGMGVKLIVQHEESPDGEKTYANISFITADKDKPMKPSGGYTRSKDRDDNDAPDAKDEPKKSGWETCVVHVGKHKGKTLGTLDEADVAILIDKWLPKAKAKPAADDKPLISALEEVAALLTPAESEDY